jgi:mannose-6-phosphate isomerase-like protein (cupin superfamily)
MNIFEERPWGNYRVLHRESGIQVKRIEVNPGLRFSLQKHLKRSEKWIVIAGKGVATVADRQIPVHAGDFLEVASGVAHRIHNTASEPLVFIEVQFGDYLGEDDIVRLEDDFGRK